MDEELWHGVPAADCMRMARQEAARAWRIWGRRSEWTDWHSLAMESLAVAYKQYDKNKTALGFSWFAQRRLRWDFTDYARTMCGLRHADTAYGPGNSKGYMRFEVQWEDWEEFRVPAFEDAIEARFDLAVVMQVLPPSYRRAMVDMGILELTTAEYAQKYGVSATTGETMFCTAKKRCRKAYAY